MKKLVIILLIAMWVTAPVAAGGDDSSPRKWRLSLLAGVGNTAEIGSEGDYAPGENDFPVTPSHSSSVFGVSLGYSFSQSLALEISGRFFGDSDVTLSDPSDGDTVEFKTAKHKTVMANLLYSFGVGKFKPYLTAGIGLDSISADDQTVVSTLGYEIQFFAPEKKTDFLFNIGVGTHFHLGDTFGLTLDARYISVLSKPDKTNILNLMAGLFIKL